MHHAVFWSAIPCEIAEYFSSADMTQRQGCTSSLAQLPLEHKHRPVPSCIGKIKREISCRMATDYAPEAILHSAPLGGDDAYQFLLIMHAATRHYFKEFAMSQAKITTSEKSVPTKPSGAASTKWISSFLRASICLERSRRIRQPSPVR